MSETTEDQEKIPQMTIADMREVDIATKFHFVLALTNDQLGSLARISKMVSGVSYSPSNQRLILTVFVPTDTRGSEELHSLLNNDNKVVLQLVNSAGYHFSQTKLSLSKGKITSSIDLDATKGTFDPLILSLKFKIKEELEVFAPMY